MSQVKNIPVFIRAKPNEEKKTFWHISSNCTHAIDNNGQKLGEVYIFDHIFDESQSNEDVYKLVEPMVVSAMDGYNTTIFTYGQTSSGKTYTMMGTDKVQGIVQMCFQSIFKMVDANPNKRFLIRLSIIEIYNEKINDLLDIGNQNVKIRETIHGNVDVHVKTEVVTNVEQVLHLAKIGNKNRKIGSTDMNERSSRSHLIFRIAIEGIDIVDGHEVVNSSQVNLVDLAGSERLAYTGAKGERLKEGVNINKSLSSLTRVIRQLNEDGRTFVNFRDSKLTRLLQDSLGGNSNTVIIANINPAFLEETMSTLNFAKEAKLVKNQAVKNEYVTMEEEGKWQEIQELKREYETKLLEETERNKCFQEKQEKLVKDLEDKLRALSSFRNFTESTTSEKKPISKRRYTLHNPLNLASTNSSDVFRADSSNSSQLSVGLPQIKEESSASTTPVKEEPATPEPVLRLRCSELEKSYRELSSFLQKEQHLEDGIDYKVEFQKMRDNFFEVKTKLDEQSKKLKQLEEERTVPPTEETALREQLQQLQQDLLVKNKVVAQFEEHEEFFKQKLTLLEGILSDKTKSQEDLESKYADLEKKYQELEQKENDLCKEIDQYREHTTRLIIENKDIHLKFDNVLFEKNELETKLADLEKLRIHNEQFRAQIASLNQEYARVAAENVQHNADKLKLTIEYSDLSINLARARQLEDDLNMEIDDLRRQILRFHAENNDVNVQLESTYNSRDTLQAEVDRLQQVNDNLLTDIEKYQEENEALHENFIESQSELDYLNTKCERAVAAEQELLEQNKKIADKVANLTKELENANSQYEAVFGENEALKLANESWQEKCTALSEEIKEFAKLAGQADEKLRRESLQLAHQFLAAQSESAKKRDMVIQLEQKNKDLNDMLVKDNAAMQRKLDMFHKQNQQLERQVDNFEKENKVLNESSQQACTRLEKLTADMEKMEKHYNVEIDKMDNTHLKMAQEVAGLNAKITGMAAARKYELDELQLEIERLGRLLIKAEDREESIKNDYETKLANLQSKKDQLQKEYDLLIEANKQLKETMENILEQLDNNDKEHQVKMENMNRKCLNLSNDIDKLKSQIHILKSEKNQNIEQEYKELLIKMVDFKAENTRLAAEAAVNIQNVERQTLLEKSLEKYMERLQKLEKEYATLKQNYTNNLCETNTLKMELDKAAAIKEENKTLSDSIVEFGEALENFPSIYQTVFNYWEERIKEMNEKLEKAKNRADTMRVDLDKLNKAKARIDELETELAKKTPELDEAEKLKQELQEQLEESKDLVRKLQDDAAKKNEEQEMCQLVSENLNKEKARVVELETELNEKAQQLDSAKKFNQELREQLEKSQDLHKKLQDDAAKMNEVQEMLKIITENLDKEKTRVFELETELAEKTQELNEAEKSKKHLREQLEQSKVLILRLQDDAAKMNQELEMSKFVTDNLNKEKARVVQLQTELSQKTQQLDQAEKSKQELQEQLKNSEGLVRKLQLDNKSLNEELEMSKFFTENLNKEEARVVQLETELAKKTQEFKEAENSKKQLQEQLEQSKGLILRLQDDAARMHQELKMSKFVTENLNKEKARVVQLQTELNKKTQELDEAEKSKQKLQEQLEDSEDLVRILQQDNEILNEELEMSKFVTENLNKEEARVVQLKTELAKKTQELDDAEKLKKQLEHRLKDSEDLVRRLQDDATRLQQDYEMYKFVTQNQGLSKEKADVDELEAKLAQKTQEFHDAERSMEELREELEESQDRILRLQENAQRMNDEYRRVVLENHRLKFDDETDVAVERFLQKLREYASSSEEHFGFQPESYNALHSSIYEFIHNRLAANNKERDEARAKLQETAKRLFHAEAEVERLTEEGEMNVQLREADERQREYIAELEKDLDTMREYTRGLEMNLNRIEHQLKETTEQMQQYFKQRNEFRAEVEQKDAQIQDLNRQCTKLKNSKNVDEQEGRRSLGSPREMRTRRREEMFDRHRNLYALNPCDECMQFYRKLKELESELEKKEKQYKEAMEKYAVKSYENTDLKGKLDRLINEKEAMKIKYKEDMEQLKNKMLEQIQELENKCESQNHVPREKYEMVKKVCELRKEEIKQLKAQLNQK